MKASVLVRHRPSGDLLDVNLAAEHDAKVLLLLVPRQRHSNALRLGRRQCRRANRDAVQICGRRRGHRWGENDASFDNEADRLAGVPQDLDRGRVVHALEGDPVGGNDAVVDSEKKIENVFKCLTSIQVTWCGTI